MQKQKTQNLVTNREFKASAFTTYFGTPERAAELYQALGKGENVKPEDIMFETLSGVLYMARKNDMAFTVKNKVLVIGEHQSTVNDNMPVRSAIYYGRTMEKLIEPRKLYQRRQIKIPTPEFYMFYNGREKQPMERILHLSDSYLEKTEEPMLELKVKMININPSANHPILQQSRSVYEYSWFIQRVHEYIGGGMLRDEAIEKTIQDCLKLGIMVDFIEEHGSEVQNMIFTEFNLEDAKQVWREEAKAEGCLEMCLEMGMTKEACIDKIVQKFGFMREEVEWMVDQYLEKDIGEKIDL